jgi:nitrite reductase (NO-forming)
MCAVEIDARPGSNDRLWAHECAGCRRQQFSSEMNSESPQPNPPPDTEPTSGMAVMPIWLFVLIAVVAYWGLSFQDGHGGGFHPKVYEPYVSYEQLVALQPRSKTGLMFDKGQKIYRDNCQVCHQPSGTGVPFQFPPLAGSEWVLALKPDRIIRIVLHGLQGSIQVRGTEWQNVQMPNIGSAANLSDDDIAAVLTFIRGNQIGGNDASPVTAEQVKAVRDQTVDRTDLWTPDELIKVPDR